MIRLALALALAQIGFHAYIAALPLAMTEIGRPDDEIGAIMGSASLFNIAAGLLAGGLIDRYGGRLVYLLGIALYAAASVPFAVGLIVPDSSAESLLLVRLLQGAGLAAVFPAIVTVVPTLVSRERLATALASVGVAANLSLALSPTIAIMVLERWSLNGVGVMALLGGAAGALLIGPSGVRAIRARRVASRARADAVGGGQDGGGAADGTVAPLPVRRGFRLAWQSSWAMPLSVTVLFLFHWGVVLGYLPQRTVAHDADVGLFFAAEALALLTARIPAGYLTNRIGSLPLVVGGVIITVTGLLFLLPAPTTGLLIIAGIGVGAGTGLVVPTIMYECSIRSTTANRGSAFSLFSIAFSAGSALGSVGVAPFFPLLGFEGALLLGIGALAVAGVVALSDRQMRLVHRPLR